MKDYKINNYRRVPSDTIVIPFVAICLGYIVVGMSFSQIAAYFGF